MTTSPRAALPIARNVVERVNRRHRSSLCTAAVLDDAGALLDAWCLAAAERGTDMSGDHPGGEWAERLAVVALEMATRQVRQPRPSTPMEATVLLDTVVDRLAERGITTGTCCMYRCPVPTAPLPGARSSRADWRSPSTSTAAGRLSSISRPAP